jgi:hypothetical protein
MKFLQGKARVFPKIFRKKSFALKTSFYLHHHMYVVGWKIKKKKSKRKSMKHKQEIQLHEERLKIPSKST